MSKRTLYFLTAFFLFALFTLTNLPITVVLKWTDTYERGMRWENAEGTIWYGTLTNVSFREYALGTVNYQTSVFSLLAGKLAGRATVEGPALVAKSHFSVGLRGSLKLHDSALLLDLGQYDIRDAFDAPMRGALRLDIETLAFKNTACWQGAFRLWTDTLKTTARRYGGEGFPLSGEGRCEDGMLILPISGQNGTETVSLEVQLDGGMDYQAEVRVKSKTSDLIAALRLYGFDSQGEQLVMIQRGNLLTNP